MDPEYLKHMHPQWVNYKTMEEKMIHRFLVTASHTTPILQGKDLLQTYVWNSPLKTGLQGEGAQKLIYTWLNLYLIHVGH